jgi:hypothetical protein
MNPRMEKHVELLELLPPAGMAVPEEARHFEDSALLDLKVYPVGQGLAEEFYSQRSAVEELRTCLFGTQSNSLSTKRSKQNMYSANLVVLTLYTGIKCSDSTPRWKTDGTEMRLKG